MNAITDYYRWHINAIPRDTLAAAAKSSLTSFVLAAIYTNAQSIEKCLFHGLLGGVISLIYSVTTPIFVRIFDERESVGLMPEFVRVICAVGITQLLVNSISTQKHNLLTANLSLFAINLFFDSNARHSLRHSRVFFG